jgi:hypothetical protein
MVIQSHPLETLRLRCPPFILDTGTTQLHSQQIAGSSSSLETRQMVRPEIIEKDGNTGHHMKRIDQVIKSKDRTIIQMLASLALVTTI